MKNSDKEKERGKKESGYTSRWSYELLKKYISNLL